MYQQSRQHNIILFLKGQQMAIRTNKIIFFQR